MAEVGHDGMAGARGQGAPDFVFIGGVPALDLVNTEVVVRGKRRDLLNSPEDVARWWEAVRRHHPDMAEVQAQTTYDGDLLEALRALRAALRGIFSAVVVGTDPREADLDMLNAILSTGHHALEIAPGNLPRGVYRTTEDTGQAAILLPIALSAFRLLTEGNRDRLHKCGNERCILLLYDTTKSATRRWCSVACKDRERKMKRYHQERC